MALITNLEAAWELGNVSDAHGANTLTNNATVTFVAGKVGNAANFVAASSQFLSRADNASLSTGDIDFSFDTWLQLTSKATTQDFIAKLVTDAASSEYALRYNSATDRWNWIVSDGTNFIIQVADVFGSPALATWYHLHVQHDSVNNLLRMWVNDVVETPVAIANGPTSTGAGFAIGQAGEFGVNFVDGLGDQTFFWKRLPDAAERTWLDNGGAGRSYAEVLAGMPVATPAISPNGGSFVVATEVTLTCATAGADIYYTLDGSTPDDTKTLYTVPFTLTEDTTVKAIGIAVGFTDSAVETAVFDIEIAAPASDTSDRGRRSRR